MRWLVDELTEYILQADWIDKLAIGIYIVACLSVIGAGIYLLIS